MKSLQLTVSILFLFTLNTLQAQRLDIFGGINTTNLSHSVAGKKQDNTGTINFLAGIGVFVPFSPKAYKKDNDGSGVFPTLAFIKKGTAKTTAVGPTQADVKLSYLQLNLPIAYTAGAYGVGFGPYAAYALSGTRQNRTGNTNEESIDFSNEIKRFDFGLSVDLTISLFKFQYDLGLADLGTGTNGTVKTRSLSLSLNIPLVN